MPFSQENFYYDLTAKQRERLYTIQEELFDSGFAKDADLVQAECFNEAVRILRKELSEHTGELSKGRT